MTDRPIDPNDITPEMVAEIENIVGKRNHEWNEADGREIIAAVLTCARRWKLGTAEEPLERVTMGDMVRYAAHIGPVDDEDKEEAVRIAREVAAWKEGRR